MARFAATLLLLLALHANLQADVVIATPTGLTTGQGFRIMVVTTGTTVATSTDINYYNNFVANDIATNIGAYRYGGNAVSFKAWGTTASVSAISNIGWVQADQVGVYRADGTRIATSANFLTGTHETGVTSAGTSLVVFTGTPTSGTNPGTNVLGTTRIDFEVMGGTSDAFTAGSWTQNISPLSNTQNYMYAISDVITVPEPGTYLLGALSTSLLAGMMFFRWRRDQRKRLSLAMVSAE
jgi:hypothetical protein